MRSLALLGAIAICSACAGANGVGEGNGNTQESGGGEGEAAGVGNGGGDNLIAANGLVAQVDGRDIFADLKATGSALKYVAEVTPMFGTQPKIHLVAGYDDGGRAVGHAREKGKIYYDSLEITAGDSNNGTYDCSQDLTKTATGAILKVDTACAELPSKGCVTYAAQGLDTAYSFAGGSCLVNVTKIGGVGEPVVGTFSGVLLGREQDGTSSLNVMNGAFNIIRTR